MFTLCSGGGTTRGKEPSVLFLWTQAIVDAQFYVNHAVFVISALPHIAKIAMVVPIGALFWAWASDSW
jgi:hypothetical protein